MEMIAPLRCNCQASAQLVAEIQTIEFIWSKQVSKIDTMEQNHKGKNGSQRVTTTIKSKNQNNGPTN